MDRTIRSPCHNPIMRSISLRITKLYGNEHELGMSQVEEVSNETPRAWKCIRARQVHITCGTRLTYNCNQQCITLFTKLY
jgi:hypothetical protein